MDPKECLRQADQFISDLQYLDARIRLAEYWRWRARGGFQPIEVAGTLQRGDDFARECRRRLDSATNAKPVIFSVGVDEPPMPWSQDGFTSLDSALLWATTEAKRIEQQFADDECVGQIFCEDTIGNSWNLIEENGIYTWEPADVIDEQYPIIELPAGAL